MPVGQGVKKDNNAHWAGRAGMATGLLEGKAVELWCRASLPAVTSPPDHIDKRPRHSKTTTQTRHETRRKNVWIRWQAKAKTRLRPT